MARDATGLTSEHQAVDSLEASLRLALDAGQMGTWEWRIPEGRVIWSETLERIHGLAPGTFGGTFDDYARDIHPDDRGLVEQAVVRTMAGEAHRLRYRIVRPDGAVRWLDARGTLLRDPHGAPLRLVGVCTDVTERERAEAALRLLAEAGQALHASLDLEATLQAVAHLAVPVLADYCIVDLIDEGRVRRVAAAHADSDRQPLVAALRDFPPSLRNDGPVMQVALTRRPLLIDDWETARKRWGELGPDHEHLVRALSARCVMCVPLTGPRVEVLGVLTFAMAESGRRYDDADLRVAEALAARAASAVENARLHRTVVESDERHEQQALELELQAQQLQEQATELEAQQVELERANHELAEARRAAEAAHRDLAGILGAIADPFVVHDTEWRFRYVNAAAAQVFARAGSTDSVLGRSVWELYPHLVGTPFEREMRRACAERVPVAFEAFYAPGGTWSEQRCYPLADGGLATVWRDITEQKRAEERLHFLSQSGPILTSSLDYRATVTRLAQLLVPRLADWCGVQLLDEAGALEQLAVAHVDPDKVRWAWELGRRYPVDMDAPSGAPNVLRTGVSELYEELTDELLAAGARDEEHLRIIRELGMTSVMIVPLPARGRIIGVMTLIAAESGRRYTSADQALAESLAERAALAIDNARLFTDAEEKTRTAEAARAEAEQANRAKADFLAHMSHELRTPLNAIAGYAQLMDIGVHGPLTAEQREDLARITRAQRHLLALINDVLNFAKLEAGHLQYRLEPLDVAAEVEALEALVAPQLAAKSLRYDGAGIEAGLVATGDREKVRQVLLNVLSNAAKFTAPGGHIHVAAARHGDTVRIAVRDSGIGIAPDKMEAIFEPFVQLDRTLASAHQGTGLGLAISRDLARGMGGDLVVASVPDEGSTFTLVLPAASG